MRINDNNCVDKAENVIKNLVKGARKNFKGEPDIVTTSKIRNLLAMNADIYNQVLTKSSEKLDDEICGRIEYLRVRFMYECGREPKVKEFVQQAEILEILKEIKQSKKKLSVIQQIYGGIDRVS